LGDLSVSFELGKKLGFIASLIAITVPIALVIAYGVFCVQLFTFIQSSAPSGTASTSDLLSDLSGLSSFAIGLAVLSIVGFVLFMVAMHQLAKHYVAPSIFRNLLKALLTTVGTSILAPVLAFVRFLDLLDTGTWSASADSSALFIRNFFIIMIVILLVVYAISIYCGILYKRSFDTLAAKSAVANFRTAGLLYLIGVIIPIGVISWIAWIFAAIGYRKLQPVQHPAIAYPLPPNPGMTSRCPNCGTENVTVANYCSVCGQQKS